MRRFRAAGKIRKNRERCDRSREEFVVASLANLASGKMGNESHRAEIGEQGGCFAISIEISSARLLPSPEIRGAKGERHAASRRSAPPSISPYLTAARLWITVSADHDRPRRCVVSRGISARRLVSRQERARCAACSRERAASITIPMFGELLVILRGARGLRQG